MYPWMTRQCLNVCVCVCYTADWQRPAWSPAFCCFLRTMTSITYQQSTTYISASFLRSSSSTSMQHLEEDGIHLNQSTSLSTWYYLAAVWGEMARLISECRSIECVWTKTCCYENNINPDIVFFLILFLHEVHSGVKWKVDEHTFLTSTQNFHSINLNVEQPTVYMNQAISMQWLSVNQGSQYRITDCVWTKACQCRITDCVWTNQYQCRAMTVCETKHQCTAFDCVWTKAYQYRTTGCVWEPRHTDVEQLVVYVNQGIPM